MGALEHYDYFNSGRKKKDDARKKLEGKEPRWNQGLQDEKEAAEKKTSKYK